MTPAPAKLSITITPPVRQRVYLDYANSGQIGDQPQFWTCSDGTFECTLDPVSNLVVRQVLPVGFTQTTPASNYGVHITVGPAGVATANFVNAAVVPSNPPPTAPVPPPVTPAQPPAPLPPTPSGKYQVGWCISPDTKISDVVRDSAPFGGCRAVNFFMDDAIDKPAPANSAAWAKVNEAVAAGVGVYLSCFNFQNNHAARTKIPADYCLAHAKSFPRATSSFNPIIILADEHDNPGLNTDTVDNFVKFLDTVCPVLTSLGYSEAMLTWTYTWGWMQDTRIVAAIKRNPIIKRAGQHPGDGEAATSLGEHDKRKPYIESLGLIYDCSQAMLHKVVNMSVELPALYAGLEQRNIPVCAYPIYTGPKNEKGEYDQPGCPCAPYLSPGVPNPAVYPFLKPILS